MAITYNNLKEFVDAFPEEVLFQWLKAGHKAYLKKLERKTQKTEKFTKTKANKLLKGLSKADLDQLKEDVLG